jgi:hypothetical protein
MSRLSLDEFQDATAKLIGGEPTTFSIAIRVSLKEQNASASINPEALNMLDGLLCHFTFILLSLSQTMREFPSQEDVKYCAKVMGFGQCLSPFPSPSLSELVSVILAKLTRNIFDETLKEKSVIVEEMDVGESISDTDLHTTLQELYPKTYLFDNSEFIKTNSAYIGPWKLMNGGEGNCLFYSLRQLITIWRTLRNLDDKKEGEVHTLWPEKLPGQEKRYKKTLTKFKEDSHRLRHASANYFLKDLDGTIPGIHRVSFMKDKIIQEREMTKADFIYMAKDGDLKLEPQYEDERKAWATKWCEKAKENGEWGCMRMITGFAHIIVEPRSIAIYFFKINERERSRSLERTDEQSIQTHGALPVISKDRDAILHLPVKRVEDEIRVRGEIPLKRLGLCVKKGSAESWNLARAPLQRHCALYHEDGRHWCVLVSALQREELRQFTNIDTVAKPLFQ